MEYCLGIRKAGPFEFIQLDYMNVLSEEGGHPSLKIPENKFTASLGLKNKNWSYGLFTHVGSQFSSRNQLLDAYSFADLNVNYSYDKNTKLFAKIHNIGDTEYEEVAFYATPGRTFFFGLKKTF